jgi:hypothetical protein
LATGGVEEFAARQAVDDGVRGTLRLAIVMDDVVALNAGAWFDRYAIIIYGRAGREHPAAHDALGKAPLEFGTRDRDRPQGSAAPWLHLEPHGRFGDAGVPFARRRRDG